MQILLQNPLIPIRIHNSLDLIRIFAFGALHNIFHLIKQAILDATHTLTPKKRTLYPISSDFYSFS